MTPPDDFTAREEAPFRPSRERPIGALFTDLTEDLSKLFKLEIELFKRELAEKAGRLGRGGAAIAAGGMLAFSAWLALLAAAILGIVQRVGAMARGADHRCRGAVSCGCIASPRQALARCSGPGAAPHA